ncbi:hypothetical protein pmac_cds_588 [Pandoravirus macleodensis]|uniref:DUF5878 domain-containing protein n=1 Tax=Pandoravirus macleodensis TaxID=2107707 RepID=A0A2U7UFP4_9VIRU|nr:hypothetical protein pmac_cds_588 [Pandoravirus macleodensis]AVK77276.1 hypothetical protein pmac_cds_588 [Pandoravirus macleodensis]
MLRACRKRTQAWIARKRRPVKRKRPLDAGNKHKMSSTATTVPGTPQDRETRWKMHVLCAVDRGDPFVTRPPNDNTVPDAISVRSTDPTGAGDDDDTAFVRLALDVLDDCREVVCARPLREGVVAIGPRASALWGDALNGALDAARQEAAMRSPVVLDMRTIHNACGATWPLTARSCDILGKMITTRAAARHMDAAVSAPFLYRLTLNGTDGAEPGPEQWPPIGWALAKAYCMVVAVVVPLILALCANVD